MEAGALGRSGYRLRSTEDEGSKAKEVGEKKKEEGIRDMNPQEKKTFIKFNTL